MSLILLAKNDYFRTFKCIDCSEFIKVDNFIEYLKHKYYMKIDHQRYENYFKQFMDKYINESIYPFKFMSAQQEEFYLKSKSNYAKFKRF